MFFLVLVLFDEFALSDECLPLYGLDCALQFHYLIESEREYDESIGCYFYFLYAGEIVELLEILVSQVLPRRPHLTGIVYLMICVFLQQLLFLLSYLQLISHLGCLLFGFNGDVLHVDPRHKHDVN